MMKPVTRYLLMSAAVLAVVSGVVLPKALAPASSSTAPLSAKERTKAPLRVTAMIVEAAELQENVTSTGSLLAEEAVDLQAETDGKVIAIDFREGAHVRKGALLVKLNDEDLAASLARAQYRRELAALRERRFDQLVKQGVARQEEYDTALNELNVQQAEIALIEAQIRKTEIRAPFDGVVGLRYVSEGSYVNAATRIATLQRVDRIKIDFALPEKYAARLRIDSAIEFSVAGSERRFQGRIYAIDPRIDAATRTVPVRAICDNADGRLLPGAFASVHVTLASLSDALLVPAVALVPGLTETSVFIVKDGKAERRVVQTGTRTDSTVHVLDGLSSGETVITSGLQQVRAGQEVTVIGVLDGKQSS